MAAGESTHGCQAEAGSVTMGMFIRVDVNQDVVKETAGLAEKLVEVCPVNIFAPGTEEGAVSVVGDNEDECTLCDLCIQASPEGVKIVKLYDS
jgi:NAD-dependent dihydropyrimidine dehydrogenase PreA subunit